MSSRSEIRFNFNQAKEQAKQLDEIAAKIEKLSTQTMENNMRTLSANWAGDNATAFLKKEDIIKRNIKKTASEIRDIASDIRSIAKRVYDAEMEALRIARSRKS